MWTEPQNHIIKILNFALFTLDDITINQRIKERQNNKENQE